jgi:hypothetical protein
MKISRLCLLGFFLFSVTIFGSGALWAAIPQQAKSSAQWLLKDGVVRGGKADNYMSLLDLRRSYSPQAKTERLIFDWGDKILGMAPHGGYYQVEYRAASGKTPAKVIVSLSLTLNSRIEKSQLTEKVKGGLYIKQARLEFDPIGQAQNLTFELRKPVRVRVMSYAGRVEKPQTPARLVVDFVE